MAGIQIRHAMAKIVINRVDRSRPQREAGKWPEFADDDLASKNTDHFRSCVSSMEGKPMKSHRGNIEQQSYDEASHPQHH